MHSWMLNFDSILDSSVLIISLECTFQGQIMCRPYTHIGVFIGICCTSHVKCNVSNVMQCMLWVPSMRKLWPLNECCFEKTGFFLTMLSHLEGFICAILAVLEFHGFSLLWIDNRSDFSKLKCICVCKCAEFELGRCGKIGKKPVFFFLMEARDQI